MLLPGSVLDPGRRLQSGPGLNGFGTGYRSPSGRGVPEPAGDCTGSVRAIRPSAWRTAPHRRTRPDRQHPCKNSVGHGLLRIGQFWACQARHLGGPPLSRGARSGAGAWLAAGVTGPSGWTQRSSSHLRRGRTDTDARDRRLSHADADHKKRCRGHGRETTACSQGPRQPAAPGPAAAGRADNDGCVRRVAARPGASEPADVAALVVRYAARRSATPEPATALTSRAEHPVLRASTAVRPIATKHA